MGTLLRVLTERQREVALLRWGEQRSINEIAEQLSRAPCSVKRRLAGARLRLRRHGLQPPPRLPCGRTRRAVAFSQVGRCGLDIDSI